MMEKNWSYWRSRIQMQIPKEECYNNQWEKETDEYNRIEYIRNVIESKRILSLHLQH